MDNPAQQQQVEQPAEPSEYETFKVGLRQIMSVPKAEIDRREADWQKQQDTKRKGKKRAV